MIRPGTEAGQRTAWIVSVAAHALVLVAVFAAGRRDRAPSPSLPVSLRAEARLTASPPSRTPPGLPLAPPRPRPERRARAFLQRPPVRALIPPSPDDPAAVLPRWDDYDRASVRAWTEHSLVTWLAECRTGRPAPDTLLERARTPRETAREELARGLYRDFVLRAPSWDRERFLEAYRRNFPLMR